MSRLWIALLLLAGFACAADRSSGAAGPTVAECFKVHRLLKTDATHYWADWSNTCPYTIDSVYVLVRFVDGFRKYLGDGVWPMYFVLPGAHRVTRFSVPVGVDGFESILVRQITTDSVEALR